MKKFKFSLQKVLEFNTHIQKKEKDILAALRAEYDALTAEEKLLINEYENAKQEYAERAASGMKVIDTWTMLDYIKNIKDLIEAQRKKINDKKVQIDKQSAKLIAVTQDKMTVEKLRESKLNIYNFNVQKSEEKFIEEFISNRDSSAV